MSYQELPDTQYEIVVYWSREDNCFIAEVPELLGCAVDAPTRQKALEAAEREIAAWIMDAKKAGVEIPEPKGRVPFAVE